jgi:hypothetical protein
MGHNPTSPPAQDGASAATVGARLKLLRAVASGLKPMNRQELLGNYPRPPAHPATGYQSHIEIGTKELGYRQFRKMFTMRAKSVAMPDSKLRCRKWTHPTHSARPGGPKTK